MQRQITKRESVLLSPNERVLRSVDKILVYVKFLLLMKTRNVPQSKLSQKTWVLYYVNQSDRLRAET